MLRGKMRENITLLFVNSVTEYLHRLSPDSVFIHHLGLSSFFDNVLRLSKSIMLRRILSRSVLHL